MEQTTDRRDEDMTWAVLQAAIQYAARVDAQAELDAMRELRAVVRPYMENNPTITVEQALALLRRDKGAELLARRKRWGL